MLEFLALLAAAMRGTFEGLNLYYCNELTCLVDWPGPLWSKLVLSFDRSYDLQELGE